MDSNKAKYNKALARYRKALTWIDAPERTPEEIKQWTPEYLKIIRELSVLSSLTKPSQEEAINGFKD